MKSQFRCLLFSILVGACGGEPEGTSTAVTRDVPVVPEKPVVPGFGEAKPAVPVVVEGKAAAELPAVEHFIPEKLSEAMSLGKELAAKGEHVRARELFEAAAKKDRTAAEPQIELARSYITTGDKAKALRHANKAVKLAPESSSAYNTLGRAELLRHDYDAAILAFRQATELAPDNVWAWNNLGLVYLTLKDYQEAVNALAEATSRKGAEGYMWNNLGLAYEQLDQLDDARDAFESGAKLGSVAAKASRKRLEGVDTIVVAKKTEDKPGKAPVSGEYDDREPMPDVPDDVDEEPVLEEPVLEEPVIEEPEPGSDEPGVDEAPIDAGVGDAPVTEPGPSVTN